MYKKNSSLQRVLSKVLLVSAVCLVLAGLSGVKAKAALNRNDFPIKVYINPYMAETKTAENTGELISEDALRSIRQGVLDYTRLVMTAPSGADSLFYVFTLRKQAEEKEEAKLLDAGVFEFVGRPEQATLIIEGANRTRLDSIKGGAESPVGTFQTTRDLRVGRILLALQRNVYEQFTEFDLRIVLMHEIGHALGLEHQDEQKCNFMAPVNYSCFSDRLLDCKSENLTSRCIGVLLSQIRAVDSQIAAEPGKDEPDRGTGPVVEMQNYATAIQTKVAEMVSSLPQASQRGKLALTVATGGVLKEISVAQSFGSEADAAIVTRVRKMSPFDPLPAAYTETDFSFTLTLTPKRVVDDYVQQIKPAVLAQLARLTGLTQVGQVYLQIFGKGEIGEVKSLASFGSDRLDQQAIANIKALSPLPPIANFDATDSIYATFNYGPQRTASPVKSKQP